MTFTKMIQRVVTLAAVCIAELTHWGLTPMCGEARGQTPVEIGYRIESGDEYARNRCKLDLHVPAKEGFETLIWLHGGGLENGDKRDAIANGVVKFFLSHNVAVASVNYRLSPKASYPNYIEDASAALDEVQRQVAHKNGATSKIFVAGHSAGGYLAAMLGTDESYLKARGLTPLGIAGVIPVSGQMVTHSTVKKERGIPKSRILVDEAAPCFHVKENLPPFLCIAADGDLPMRKEENSLFVAALQAAGHREAKYVEFTGRNHDTIASRMSESGDAVAETILQFIRSRSAEIDRINAQWKQSVQHAFEYEQKAKKIPSLSYAIVTKNGKILEGAQGFSRPSSSIPADLQSIYRVGSVSKLFTDIAVMQLVEEEKLNLASPIRHWLSNVPDSSPLAGPITLQQLMTHRSGIVRESPIGNYFDSTEPTLEATIQSLHGTKQIYPIDTKTKYSNAAIAVVGHIIENVSATPFSQYMHQRLLRPIGMKQSDFDRTPLVESKLVDASMWTYDGRRFDAPKFLLGTGPAGNMYASVQDLTLFLQTLLNRGQTPSGERILREHTLEQMLTPIQDKQGNALPYGIGFRVQNWQGHRKAGHGGAVYGFSTQLEFLPDDGVGVIAIGSLDGCNATLERLTQYALQCYLAAQESKPIPVYETTNHIAADRIPSIIGFYNSGSDHLQIDESDGRCYLHHGVYRLELRADAKGSIITDDPNGYGTRLQWATDGNLQFQNKTWVRQRVDTPPATIRPEWKGMIGEYGWDHNTLYVLEDQGKLNVLIEWFFKYPLDPIDQDLFAFPSYGLYHGEEVRFHRNARGEIDYVIAANVVFPRRNAHQRDGETFKITPQRPVASLQVEALQAKPPLERGEFRDADLVELIQLDSTIQLDIRYATENNFMGTRFYQQPRAFLQRPAAEAVVRAHQALKPHGLGLLIHDGYRPWYVTKMFWEATPNEMRQFVANPANGSRHNRGCAVDLSLFDLKTGKPIEMVSGYDEFSHRAYPQYPGGTSSQRWYRSLLKNTMESQGFRVYEHEWWHFDFQDWKQYRIGTATFDELKSKK